MGWICAFRRLPLKRAEWRGARRFFPHRNGAHRPHGVVQGLAGGAEHGGWLAICVGFRAMAETTQNESGPRDELGMEF
jgi:hypothetical protein